MFRRLRRWPSIRRLPPLGPSLSPLTYHRPLSHHQHSSVAPHPPSHSTMTDPTITMPPDPSSSSSDEPIISIHRAGHIVEQGSHSQLLQGGGTYTQLARQAARSLHCPPQPPSAQQLLWLDLEMTGLDESVDRILEVAVIITDITLRPRARYHAVVQQPPSALTHMSSYVRDMHTRTGLLDRLSTGKSEQQVEAELCALVDGAFGEAGGKDVKVLLAGNTVHMDRRFIRRYWPELERRLHYRIVDVSSWKEVFANLWGVVWHKRNAHEALSDVEESIAELAYYLSFVHVTADKLQQDPAGHTHGG